VSRFKKEILEVSRTSEVWRYTHVRRRIQKYIRTGVRSIKLRVE
jgi:hypothetical protein